MPITYTCFITSVRASILFTYLSACLLAKYERHVMPATYSQMDQGKKRVCVCLREREKRIKQMCQS